MNLSGNLDCGVALAHRGQKKNLDRQVTGVVNSWKGIQGGNGGIDSGRLVSSRNFYYKSPQNFSNTSRRTLNMNDKVRGPNVTVNQSRNAA